MRSIDGFFRLFSAVDRRPSWPTGHRSDRMVSALIWASFPSLTQPVSAQELRVNGPRDWVEPSIDDPARARRSGRRESVRLTRRRFPSLCSRPCFRNLLSPACVSPGTPRRPPWCPWPGWRSRRVRSPRHPGPRHARPPCLRCRRGPPRMPTSRGGRLTAGGRPSNFHGVFTTRAPATSSRSKLMTKSRAAVASSLSTSPMSTTAPAGTPTSSSAAIAPAVDSSAEVSVSVDKSSTR